MKNVLDFILENYSTKNEFKSNNVANYLRTIAKETIEKDAVINTNKYKVEGSPGKGNWAEVPWIGVFDRKITITATKGFYIVYLFTADMSGVYLSLNQGWTFFEDNYKGQDPREKIRLVSNSLRKKLNSGLNDFPYEKIDLRSNYKLAKGYELGHICGRFYSKNKIPEDAELINDLRNLIGVYRELVGIVGTNYENIVKDFLSQDIRKPLETKQDETELEIESLEEFDKPVNPEEYKEYKEGQKKLKQHIIRERNSQVIDEAKKNFRLKNKRVFCEICGFDFEKKYGEVGKNFIEGHHKLPISEITEESNKITSKDIALVCSNCHRILHRKRPWLTIEELKRLIE
jgi:5-methylcytosine-specific restriction enzyme A